MDGAERHEVDAVGELVKDRGRDSQAQARLAGAPGPGQSEQPGPGQQLRGLTNLVVAADEARQLCGQVVRRRLQGLQRWKIVGETVDDELEQPLRLRQVFEAMQSEVFQRQPGWQRVIHQRAGGFGNEHLPAVPSTRHPCGAVDVEAEIFIADEGGLAGVYADPNAHLAAIRPLVRMQRLLGRCRAGTGLQRAVEHDEEGVSLGAQLVTAIGRQRLPQDGVMGEEHLRVALAQPLDEARRSLDVAEEEGHRAGGQRAHAGDAARFKTGSSRARSSSW